MSINNPSSTAFSSGGTTVNVVPKSNGAGQLVDSGITDNGTTVSTTEDVNLASGKVLKWNSDTGISRNAAATIRFGNGTQADSSATVGAALYQASSGYQVTAFGAFSGVNLGTRWVYNNGTIAGTSANLTLDGKITNYNGIAAVSNGVPVEYATVDLTAQTAAITATTLYAVPAAGAGMYRIAWVATVTTAGSISSVLGGTNGFQVLYTDKDDSVVKTMPGTVVAGIDTNSTNSTSTGTISGCFVVSAKASTNIQYQMDYTSNIANSMAYNLHIKLEAM